MLTVVVGIRPTCIIMYIFYFMFFLWGMFSLLRLLENVFPAKINNSIIIRNSVISGSKNMSDIPQKIGNTITVTFRTAHKAVGKNSENRS